MPRSPKKTNKKKPSEKLLQKYKLVVDEWVKNGFKDGFKAYKKYYPNASRATADVNFSKIKSIPEISEYIEKVKKDIAERNKVTIDKCVKALDAMAFFNIKDLLNDDGTLKKLNDIPEDALMAIEGFEIDEITTKENSIGVNKKIKLSSRRANLIELMKHLGGYEKDNQQKTDFTLSTPEERKARIDELLRIAKEQNT